MFRAIEFRYYDGDADSEFVPEIEKSAIRRYVAEHYWPEDYDKYLASGLRNVISSESYQGLTLNGELRIITGNIIATGDNAEGTGDNAEGKDEGDLVTESIAFLLSYMLPKKELAEVLSYHEEELRIYQAIKKSNPDGPMTTQSADLS